MSIAASPLHIAKKKHASNKQSTQVLDNPLSEHGIFSGMPLAFMQDTETVLD